MEHASRNSADEFRSIRKREIEWLLRVLSSIPTGTLGEHVDSQVGGAWSFLSYLRDHQNVPKEDSSVAPLPAEAPTLPEQLRPFTVLPAQPKCPKMADFAPAAPTPKLPAANPMNPMSSMPVLRPSHEQSVPTINATVHSKKPERNVTTSTPLSFVPAAAVTADQSVRGDAREIAQSLLSNIPTAAAAAASTNAVVQEQVAVPQRKKREDISSRDIKRLMMIFNNVLEQKRAGCELSDDLYQSVDAMLGYLCRKLQAIRDDRDARGQAGSTGQCGEVRNA